MRHAEEREPTAVTIPATMRALQQTSLQAQDIVVLAPTATGVSRVIAFHDPALVVQFGFPDVLAD
jgi:hypothetical protein